MQSSQHDGNSQIYGDVCSFCLSVNRSTTPVLQLAESLLDWTPFKIYSLSTQLCWECKARLKNHSDFCERAVRAQEVLGQLNVQDSLALKSLSKLVTSDTLVLSIDSQIPDDTQFVTFGEIIKNEQDILKEQGEILAGFKTRNEHKDDYYERKADHIDIDKYTEVAVEGTSNETKTNNIHLCLKKSPGAKFLQNLKIDYKLYEKFTATEDELREFLKPVIFSNKCKVCLGEFRCTGNFFKHMKRFHSDCVGHYKCDVCGLGQPTETALKLHRKQHYVLYRCLAEGCRFVHKFPPRLKVHQTEHESTAKNTGTYACRICQKKFTKLCYVGRHIKRAHADATKCKLCSKDFPNRKCLYQHIKSQHADKMGSMTEKSLSKLVTSDSPMISTDSQIPDGSQFVPVVVTITKEPDVLKEEGEIMADFEIRNEYNDDYYEPEPMTKDDYFVGKQAGKDENIGVDTCAEVTVGGTPNVTKPKSKSLCAKKSSGANLSKKLQIDYDRYEKFIATEDDMRESLKPIIFMNKCKVCLRELKSVDNFVKHMKKFHSDCVGDHKCDVCGLGQPTETALKLHREQHYVLYRCLAEGCRFVHKFPATLKSHRNKHENKNKNDGTYPCPHCKRKFTKLWYVTRHIREKHATKCKHCGNDFPDRKSLYQHIKSLHLDKMLVCDICGSEFATLSSLRTHMILHRNLSQKRHTCKICKKSFDCRFKERLHQFVHNGNPRIRCRICMTEFIEEEARIRHLEIRHGVTKEEDYVGYKIKRIWRKGGPKTCDLCGVQFKFPSSLRYHIRNRHSDDRPFRCHICSDGFKNKIILENHIRKHSDARPFKCKVCDKSFKYPANLSMHKVLHTGEKAFKCDICNASFAMKTNLRAHMAIHTGIRPFKCSVCGKKFITNSSLKKHVRVH